MESVSGGGGAGELGGRLAAGDRREQRTGTAAPLGRGSNGWEWTGLAPGPSVLVKRPRVAASPSALECKLVKIVAMATADGAPVDSQVVFGQVVGVPIDDRFIVDGLPDTATMKPIARCGHAHYSLVEAVFAMTLPTA